MRHRVLGSGIFTVIMFGVVACSGGGASSAPSAAGSSAASVAPTSAAPSEASEAPSEAPSEAASAAIPSFAFPSSDKELEALLPDTLCGQKVQKLSMGGAVFASASDPSFQAILKRVGKSAADVSLAIAAPLTASNTCSAGIFRIKGADGGALKDAFLAEATKEGNTFTVTSISGKDVYVDPTSDSLGYAYFKGDAIIFAGADNDTDAASIIAALP